MLTTWTNKEIDYLINNHQLLTYSGLAKNLNKNYSAINKQICRLKLKKIRYTEEVFLKVIKESDSHKSALNKLGYKSQSPNGTYLLLINKLKPDISHFKLHSQTISGIDTSFIKYYSSYKYSTNRRKYGKLEFNLTLDEFKSIVIQKCHYCNEIGNSQKSVLTSKNQQISNLCGIDRIDNTKGYTLENSLPCCKVCNFMKGTYTYQEFLEQIKNIYLHMKKEH